MFCNKFTNNDEKNACLAGYTTDQGEWICEDIYFEYTDACKEGLEAHEEEMKLNYGSGYWQ